MTMATNNSVDVSEEQIESAQQVWNGFTHLMKYATLCTIGILAVLGLTLISW